MRNGAVDYAGLKNEEEPLDPYLNLLEETNIQDLPKNEQLAFYITAYNARAIKQVLTGCPRISSIKDTGSLWSSPWKKELSRIDGKPVGLDEIENQIIRPRFQDPRVHFPLNCASKSCPPLLSEPSGGYVPYRQLD